MYLLFLFDLHRWFLVRSLSTHFASTAVTIGSHNQIAINLCMPPRVAPVLATTLVPVFSNYSVISPSPAGFVSRRKNDPHVLTSRKGIIVLCQKGFLASFSSLAWITRSSGFFAFKRYTVIRCNQASMFLQVWAMISMTAGVQPLCCSGTISPSPVEEDKVPA